MVHLEKQGAVTVVRPRGPLKEETLDVCRTKVADSIQHGRPQLVLDCSETVLLDSESLEWLLEVDNACGMRGGGFCVCSLVPLCEEILELTGVADRLQTCRDVKSALGRFAQ